MTGLDNATHTALSIFLALAIIAVTVLIACWTIGLIDKLEELKYNRRKRDVDKLLTMTEWEDDGK